MKKLMLGNEAVARGLFEAGCKVVSSYPGTPSTEITEYATKYNEVYTEWAPNEKVAAETSLGASIGGVRSFSAMKHVGLNVAADLLFTASYTGVTGGFVIAVADDQGMHSSQNEQDSRYYAIFSKIAMLEPSNSRECKDFTKAAFDLSEQFDTPILLRLSTRVSHSQSLVECCEREEKDTIPYKKDVAKYVMMPAMAKKRHVVVEDRMIELKKYAETTVLNEIIEGGNIGVITAGIAYEFAREALGDKATYLKIGLINPLPENKIKEFASKFDKVYVIEELEPIIENFCKQINVPVIGKELFSLIGEYTSINIKEKILGVKQDTFTTDYDVPGRPPVLCPGCPHRGIFYVLKKMNLYVSGDIGCYTLGAGAPLLSIDSTICMGASISGLHGYNKAGGRDYEKKSVAVIGDSTFIHSGITGLINIAYNASNSVVLILDNSITGMTGHQQNPTTGFNIKNKPANAVDLQALCYAIGIKKVTTVDPFDVETVEELLKVDLELEMPTVIIVRRPCALLKTVKVLPSLKINDKCKKCNMCFKMGCPAIKKIDDKVTIDTTLCTGCKVCQKVCKFDAIVE